MQDKEMLESNLTYLLEGSLQYMKKIFYEKSQREIVVYFGVN